MFFIIQETKAVIPTIAVNNIPMYDKVNVFIMYELKEKQREIKKLEWYE